MSSRFAILSAVASLAGCGSAAHEVTLTENVVVSPGGAERAYRVRITSVGADAHAATVFGELAPRTEARARAEHDVVFELAGRVVHLTEGARQAASDAELAAACDVDACRSEATLVLRFLRADVLDDDVTVITTVRAHARDGAADARDEIEIEPVEVDE
jgi:hypothetical protein